MNRMRKLREKQKEQTLNKPDKVKVVLTRQQKQKKRKQWREAKQKYRAKLGPQKRRRIREKNKNYQASKRNPVTDELKKCHNDGSAELDAESQKYTPEAKRKALYRVRQHMPSDAKKYAAVLTGLMKTTPRKRKAISKEVSLTPTKKQRLDFLEESMQNVKGELEKSKNTNKTADVKKRKLIAQSVFATLRKYRKLKRSSSEIGIRYKTMLKWSTQESDDRKKRSDALSSNMIQEVTDFFIKPNISINNPDKKHVKKDLKAKHFMTITKKEAYKTFKREKGNDTCMSESKFWKLKPKNIVPLKNGKMRSCLCEKCINIEMKLKVLNKHNVNDTSSTRKTSCSNKYELNKITLCDGKQKLKCIDRKCTQCGVLKLEDHFNSIAKSSETVNWYQWETKKYKGTET